VSTLRVSFWFLIFNWYFASSALDNLSSPSLWDGMVWGDVKAAQKGQISGCSAADFLRGLMWQSLKTEGVGFQVFLVELGIIVYKVQYFELILLCNNRLEPEFCTVTWAGQRLLNVKIIRSLNHGSRSMFEYLLCVLRMLLSANAVFSRDIVSMLRSCI